MGSLGWEPCYWCWQWQYGMYIPDPVGHPLCDDCMDEYAVGQRPPWQPDAIARTANMLEAAFRGQRWADQREVVDLVASFLKPDWEP